MQRTAVSRGAAIPFYKAFQPTLVYEGQAAKVASKDKKIVNVESSVKTTRWMYNIVQKHKSYEAKLTPTAPRHALAIKGVNGSLDHHHHKSDIAKSNVAEYERSTKHALSRDFFAKKAPLAEHPLHPKTADPILGNEFIERWTLDHKARTVNDMRLGPEKLQNYILAKKSAPVAELKK